MRRHRPLWAVAALACGALLTTLAAPAHASAGIGVAAPDNLRITVLDGDSVRLRWTDRSTNETEFVTLRWRCLNSSCSLIESNTYTLGHVTDPSEGQPGATGRTVGVTHRDMAITVNSTYCFGVYARNTTRFSATISKCVYLKPTAMYVTVPHALYLPSGPAATLVRDAGLVPAFSGSGTWVHLQSPLPGVRVPTGSTVRMTLAPGEVP